jgi:hypothetical protein
MAVYSRWMRPLRLLRFTGEAPSRVAFLRVSNQLLEARDRLLTLEVRHEEGVESSRNTGYRRHLIDLRVGIIDAFLDWLEDVKRSMT